MLERAWQAGVLPVVLEDGKTYTVDLESQRLDPGGQWTLIGRVATPHGPQTMVVTSGPDAVFGVLPLPDGKLLQITTTRGVTGIAPAGGILPAGTPHALAAEPDFVLPPQAAAPVGTGRQGRMTASPVGAAVRDTTSPVDISVLALYSEALVELRGSVTAAETEVTNIFAITRQTYLDSGTRIQLILAGTKQVAIDSSSTNHDALNAITDNTVPGIDLVAARDEAGADLVALLRPSREEDWTCGVAWLNGWDRAPQNMQDRFGFSVSNVAPCGPYVLAHELAHNMGSMHDRETVSLTGELSYGAYAYSFGYRQDGPPSFATVMAYIVDHAWLGYFSSPGSNACGAACGEADHADNVRSLNQVAPIVSAFRGPRGTLSISDTEIMEPQPGNLTSLMYKVQLSGPAPAGGIQFDLEVAGGTATPDIDYTPPAATGWGIAEGERSVDIFVDVIGDDDEEQDETLVLRLANVTGAEVHDGEALGTILNDDPRLTLSGRIRFEDGATPPTEPFWMWVTEQSGFNHTDSIRVSPPDFEYEVSVNKGATLEFSMEPPPPFAMLPFKLREVDRSRVRDIVLKKGFRVSGKLQLPEGAPPLSTDMHLDIRASIDGVYQSLPYTTLKAPDYAYSHWVVPGAWLFMEVVPPEPYTPFFAVNTDVRADVHQDIALSTLPALVIWGGGRITEGPPDTHGSLGMVVELSAPAPAGGVHLRYRTVDGSATAGQDYTAMTGTLEIPEGETFAHTESIEWFGDDVVEGDEDFFLVVSNVVGANPIITRQRVTLFERSPRMSDPLPPLVR